MFEQKGIRLPADAEEQVEVTRPQKTCKRRLHVVALASLICIAAAGASVALCMPRTIDISVHTTEAPRAPNGALKPRSELLVVDDPSDALNKHNDFRAQYGAAALVWDTTLEAKANQWATGCVFEHSGGSLGPYGENLAAGAPQQSISDAIQSWMDEAPQYDPANPQASHFTQMVWKGTQQIGCARVPCGNRIFPDSETSDYTVCEYSPAGNVIGQFAENVGSTG